MAEMVKKTEEKGGEAKAPPAPPSKPEFQFIKNLQEIHVLVPKTQGYTTFMLR